MGMNRVVQGPRPRQAVAVYGGRDEEEMPDEEEDEAMEVARNVIITDNKVATTVSTETEAGALINND
jgi:hypothetical protein